MVHAEVVQESTHVDVVEEGLEAGDVVEAQVVVRQDGRLGAVALHGHQDGAPRRLHALLGHGRIVSGHGAHRGELQVDLLELDVIHGVGRHLAAKNKTKKHDRPRISS